MKQAWITKTGGPEVLQVREAPDPKAKAGEVRIRVKAAGINFADLLARQGLYPDAPKLPAVVGYEVAGLVDQVGTGAGFREGDRVGADTVTSWRRPSLLFFPCLPNFPFQRPRRFRSIT
jgi:NADPH:quinone reductase-like Zn-dependent oxidoreductase